ncbi:hypothetical protein DPMN_011428 [Dreissena polymorpha]|uniref:Uncharacterized protein n=1 Tax=Dreissena polymorpha TaxID=45954 RepID=A0A9D4N401_DREPO|nr:hypothetical protein DPMN_011428 [Dreissena polymorpha]
MLIRETATTTGFHEYWTLNVASRVLTSVTFRVLTKFHYSCISGHFHEDWTINVIYRENAPPPGIYRKINVASRVNKDLNIFGTNVLAKFHEEQAINVGSREKFLGPCFFNQQEPFLNILTRQILTPQDAQRTSDKRQSQKLTMSTLCSELIKPYNVNCPAADGHVFQQTGTIFELSPAIIRTNKTAPHPGSHEYWTINVTSIVLTGFFTSFDMASFKLDQDIIGTNLWTKFHEYQTKNVASRVLTLFEGKMLMTDDAKWTKSDPKSSPCERFAQES